MAYSASFFLFLNKPRPPIYLTETNSCRFLLSVIHCRVTSRKALFCTGSLYYSACDRLLVDSLRKPAWSIDMPSPLHNSFEAPLATSVGGPSSWATDQDWIRHRSLICRMYKEKPLQEVMNIMKSEHGFKSTSVMHCLFRFLKCLIADTKQDQNL